MQNTVEIVENAAPMKKAAPGSGFQGSVETLPGS
jgi:hypothetical protein